MSVQYQLTEQTTQEYQKKLAMAHNLKAHGQPSDFNNLHSEERKAAEALAKRFPYDAQ